MIKNEYTIFVDWEFVNRNAAQSTTIQDTLN